MIAARTTGKWLSAKCRLENCVADTLREVSANKCRLKNPYATRLFGIADNGCRQTVGYTPSLTTHLPPSRRGNMCRQGFLGNLATWDQHTHHSQKEIGPRIEAASKDCTASGSITSATPSNHASALGSIPPRAWATPRAKRPPLPGPARGGILPPLKCHDWSLVTSDFPDAQAFRGIRPDRALNAHYQPAQAKGFAP